MRGEDLQGLNIEELQQLEKMLESGLARVIETKVRIALILLQIIMNKSTMIHGGAHTSFTLPIRVTGLRTRSLHLKGRLEDKYLIQSVRFIFWKT